MWASWFLQAKIFGIQCNGGIESIPEKFKNIILIDGNPDSTDFGSLTFDIIIDTRPPVLGDTIRTWNNLQRFCGNNTQYFFEGEGFHRSRIHHQSSSEAIPKPFREGMRSQNDIPAEFFHFLLDLSKKKDVCVCSDNLVLVSDFDRIVDNRTGISFSFGENWLDFNDGNQEGVVSAAERDLLSWLGEETIQKSRIVDVGSGSGLHSLAFARLGCREILSIDVDPASVAATRDRCPQDCRDRWKVKQGSILDNKSIAEAGTFDVVYSWGVLHHTGSMWQAIKNASQLCADGGQFLLAIYAGGEKYNSHLKLKQEYNLANESRRKEMVDAELNLPPGDAGVVEETRRNAEKFRGMNIRTDAIDWLGGLPYETARISELICFLQTERFYPIRVEEDDQGGCSVFLFRKETKEINCNPEFYYSKVGSKLRVIKTLWSMLRDEFLQNDMRFHFILQSSTRYQNELLTQLAELQGRSSSGSWILTYLKNWLLRKLGKST
jgi:2-polyprenyl-6-hydroxyphenyl methylase/3-demethylubiquinone-9 3-methyltransferase